MAAKRSFVVADQVHLVDGDDDVPHAQQRGDAGVPTRLDQHALARVDEHDGERRGRGPGGHVARVLLVAGRVRDDEFAARGGKVAVSDVDRDALLAFRAQAVGEQSEVEYAGRGGARAFDGAHLVVVDALSVVQQAADQRGLAVVDGACGGEAEEVLCRLAAGGTRLTSKEPWPAKARETPMRLLLLGRVRREG